MVTGWFAGEGDNFRLLGTRCSACASVFFPREDGFCRNPGCSGGDLDEVPLSPRGRVWSYTDSRYRPPAPYVSDPELPWQPYTLIAVELEAERMVVLGQSVPGVTVADLEVGMEVEVVPGVLDEDGEYGEYGEGGGEAREEAATTWYWRPVGVGA
ncbi:zinc ribbon domain-containing protein [Streptomyces sp. BA2]|uniref:zinc ribbon domain-containing protein n=1 Tax=Streptomyces sp. BA2 TaxID=436595 RepID=UPI0013218BB9|nr:benzoylsuccinyl-CoA thiolase [Streptomyces sp. BA2]